MFCAQCGRRLGSDARFCDGCGTPTSITGASAGSSDFPPPPPLPELASSAAPAREGSEILGILLLIAPVISVFLMVFWIGNMALIQGPGSVLMGIVSLTILGTAVLATIEASQLGIGSAADVDKRARRRSGPVAWFFLLVLLWLFGYPMYLFWRSRYGRKNLVVGGILVSLVFLGTAGAMTAALEAKQREVMASLEEAQRQAAALVNPAPAQARRAAETPASSEQDGVRPLEVLEESGAPDDFGMVCVSGKLRNNTGRAFQFVTVHYLLFDAEGAQVGEATDIVQQFEPHAVWKFKACSVAEGATRFRLNSVTHL